MKERPMLMSGAMVRAILEGRKTMTRRILKVQPLDVLLPTDKRLLSFERVTRKWDGKRVWFGLMQRDPPRGVAFACRHGEVGDRIWVRETWCDDWEATDGVYYRADGDLPIEMFDAGCKWRPSIHMPRKHSRITLEVTAVRVERLQDISDAEAMAEGTPCYVCGRHMDGLSESDCHCFHKKAGVSDFRDLWDSINAERAPWASNPWVWVVEFKRMQ